MNNMADCQHISVVGMPVKESDMKGINTIKM